MIFDWEDSAGVAASIDYEGSLWVNGERVLIERPDLARRIAAQFELTAMNLEAAGARRVRAMPGMLIDGRVNTPECECGTECTFPCWQRAGIAPPCGACGCRSKETRGPNRARGKENNEMEEQEQ